MTAYVAIRIDGSYPIEDKTLTEIAQSLQLVPGQK